MNVLIYTESYYVRKTFVNALIPNGISLYHVENLDNLGEAIISNDIDIVVFDVIQENYRNVFVPMGQIKNGTMLGEKKVGVILLIGSVDKTAITQALQLGAIGFIKSNAREEAISQYVTEIYSKTKGVTPERKFRRVTLNVEDPGQRVSIKFRSQKNMQLLMGVIKDISAGGVAVELVGTFDPEALETNMEIKGMQFILDTKDVLADGVIVVYQKRFCAIRFTHMSQGDRDVLSQFIFERM